MNFSRRSIIFIFILTIIVTFFGGFKIGRYIDNTDKQLLSQLLERQKQNPSPSVEPSPTIPVVQYKTFISECGVSFSYPDTMQIRTEEPTNVRLENPNTNEFIHVMCTGADSLNSAETKNATTSAQDKIATTEAKQFPTIDKNVTVTPQPSFVGNSPAQIIRTDDVSYITISTIGKIQSIRIAVSTSLFDLFEGSLSMQ